MTKQTNKIFRVMDIMIKRNDAFSVLQTALKMESKILEETIIEGLKNEMIIDEDDFEIFGKSIHTLCKNSDVEFPTIIELLFPGNINNNQEVSELLKSIIIWGVSNEHECDECGCEMEGEEDSDGNQVWTNYECSNPCCENKYSNEPDWDSMPGGKDYY